MYCLQDVIPSWPLLAAQWPHLISLYLLLGGRDPFPCIGLIHILAVRISPRPHLFSALTVYLKLHKITCTFTFFHRAYKTNLYSVFSIKFSTNSDLWSGPGRGTMTGSIPESSSIVWYSTQYADISPLQCCGSPQLTCKDVGDKSWNANRLGFPGAEWYFIAEYD